jgi:hypothetical protein
VNDPNVYSAGSVPYEDLDGLADTSRQVLSVVTYGGAPRCASCRAMATLRAGDYHAFHTERRVDLVLRWTPDAHEAELLWWDGERYTAAELTEADRWCVTSDAYVRRAAVRMEVEGLPEAVNDIVAAHQEVPGDPELLIFVPALIQAGYRSLADDIVQECKALDG